MQAIICAEIFSCGRIAASLLLLSCQGCTTMPRGFTKGDKALHPRFGYQVTNETANHFDLELCVIWWAFACTNAEGQIEDSKKIFISFAQDYGMAKGNRVEDIPAVEIKTLHVRNGVDGGCSVRVSKRVSWAPLASSPAPPSQP